MRSGRRGGTTLVELIVVIAIVATIATIAVPTYRQYTIRTWRTEAKAALLEIRDEQERWYLRNHRYTDDLAGLGFPAGCTEHCVYTLDFPAAPDTLGFTARARPTSGGGRNGIDQTRDGECQWFTIDSRGRREAGPGPRCW